MALRLGAVCTLVLALTTASLLISVGVSSTTAGAFQNHIVLMPLAFVLLAPLGAISWRSLGALALPRAAIKATHATLMSSAALTAVVGVSYMFHAHEANQAKEIASYGQAHFESAHSWMGIVAVTLFVGNALAALVVFYGPTDKGMRAAFLPVHVFLGTVSITLTLFSVPMGIMSYAYRGTLEDTTTHPIPGAPSGQYKVAALLVVSLTFSMLLVFFPTGIGRAKSL